MKNWKWTFFLSFIAWKFQLIWGKDPKIKCIVIQDACSRKFVHDNFFPTLKTVRRKRARSGAIIQIETIDRADPMCIERYYLFELYCFEWGSAFIIARCVQKIDNILKAFRANHVETTFPSSHNSQLYGVKSIHYIIVIG